MPFSAIQFYSTTIFQTAGMADPEFGTVMVGVLKVCCVSITIFIIDRFGRKKLMILSLVGKDSTKIFSCHEYLNYRGSHIREILNLHRNVYQLYIHSCYLSLLPCWEFIIACSKWNLRRKCYKWNGHRWCDRYFFKNIGRVCAIICCFLSIWCWPDSSIYNLRNVPKFHKV